MRSIREMLHEELAWEQPRKHKRAHELRADDEIVATLRWENHHSQVAAGEAAEGRWTFKRQGLLHQRVEARARERPTGARVAEQGFAKRQPPQARQSESALEIARFQPYWRGGGTLEFPDGRLFGLRQTSFWNAEWAWTTADHDILLRINRESRCLLQKGYVDLLPAASAVPELSLLVLLGWYLIILAADDSTTAVVAASVAAAAAM